MAYGHAGYFACPWATVSAARAQPAAYNGSFALFMVLPLRVSQDTAIFRRTVFSYHPSGDASSARSHKPAGWEGAILRLQPRKRDVPLGPGYAALKGGAT